MTSDVVLKYLLIVECATSHLFVRLGRFTARYRRILVSEHIIRSPTFFLIVVGDFTRNTGSRAGFGGFDSSKPSLPSLILPPSTWRRPLTRAARPVRESTFLVSKQRSLSYIPSDETVRYAIQCKTDRWYRPGNRRPREHRCRRRSRCRCRLAPRGVTLIAPCLFSPSQNEGRALR